MRNYDFKKKKVVIRKQCGLHNQKTFTFKFSTYIKADVSWMPN